MTSIQLNLEGGQLFFLTEVKCPHELLAYFHQRLFSLGVVVDLMLIHHFWVMSGVIFGTEQDEEKSNFIFLI